MSSVPLRKKGNTKIYEEDGYTVVKLWATEIVKFNDEHIILNNGGWNTPTTRQRMNQASDEFGLGFRVFQKDWEMLVEYDGIVRPYEDEPMTLYRSQNG
jgi:hypothetical protein